MSVLSTHPARNLGALTSKVGEAVERLAYVISDYPILASGVRRALQGRYSVVHLTWAESEVRTHSDASLVVLDVTGVTTHEVLQVLVGLRLPVSIAISSLYRDQVDMYLLDSNGLSSLSALPSLLSLTA
jgi:hypothetical protein